MNERFGAVLAAGGGGTRMGKGRPKVLRPIGGVPVLAWSLAALLACPYVEETCVVCREGEMDEIARLAARVAAKTGGGKPVTFALAGEDRQSSVYNGAMALQGRGDYLLIHDGARPFAGGELLGAVCRDALAYGAATAAVPSKDTCKLSDGQGFVAGTPPREHLMAVQTPQAFRRELYLYAVEKARQRGQSYTDDCQLVEAAGCRVRLTPGDYQNFKITTPEDLLLAQAMAAERSGAGMEGQGGLPGAGGIRVGSGYDVHRLAEGRALVLGGVEIPFEKGLLGHSDADVLAHAMADALLGAAALGDIGHLFPDSDPRYKGADSLKLLGEVCARVRAAGYAVGNIDATVMAQRPKLAPHIPAMRENLALACGISPAQVSVKATTEEGLGFTGREEGIAASAVCLLIQA
ncbi:2-C-methyl-D-erythritol 2,4-cyclodiphosphate synthase [Acutalibacter caecimuris]|uniref:2-C-methyl-D-erythritol 2,4-cyclodiphosphate synthase n=1 Tax=Acutalibacter caecimuris TaxID=3093657 RepID=UPI002AC9446D|nr:2-C-methyl-D-erythritol 2,4-cyclodiphosphate synthase [Acutalibacter sp. M00118]